MIPQVLNFDPCSFVRTFVFRSFADLKMQKGCVYLIHKCASVSGPKKWAAGASIVVSEPRHSIHKGPLHIYICINMYILIYKYLMQIPYRAISRYRCIIFLHDTSIDINDILLWHRCQCLDNHRSRLDLSGGPGRWHQAEGMFFFYSARWTYPISKNCSKPSN